MRDYGVVLDDRYQIVPFAEADEVSGQAVIDFWNRENAMPTAEALVRVAEVLLVAIDRHEGLVGVSSAYLQRNPQLRMDLWYYRGFVAEAHRKSSLGWLLALIGRDHLQDRFVKGQDTRAAGMIFEVQHEGLKRNFRNALGIRTGFTFIGENQRGDHVRVRYFPGALAPEPPR